MLPALMLAGSMHTGAIQNTPPVGAGNETMA